MSIYIYISGDERRERIVGEGQNKILPALIGSGVGDRRGAFGLVRIQREVVAECCDLTWLCYRIHLGFDFKHYFFL